MENKSHAFMAGLFVILLGVATLAALYWFGGKREATQDYVVVTQRNVNGLNPQAQVRYRGIRVGKIVAIDLDPADSRNILIPIRINQDVPVTQGTVAKIAYQGVTGLAYIQLEETGKNPALLAADGGRARIPMVPSLLEELGDTGKDAARQAGELIEEARDIFNEDNRRKLSAILDNLERTSGQMVPAVDNLNATLVQARRLLDDRNVRSLSRAAGEAGPLLAEARGLVASLKSAADRLDGLIGESAASGGSALVPRLSEAAGGVSAASRQLNRVLKKIEESPRSLIFGVQGAAPGPGEEGFVPPPSREGVTP